MDTLLVNLTVSGLVGLVMGLTVSCTLIVLGLSTFWNLVVDSIVWTKVPWSERVDKAVEAAEQVLAETS
jgi:hypothetical protein